MENAKQSGAEQIVATTLPVEDAEQAGTEARLVAGRALVDIPVLGLKCGQFAKVESSALVGRIEAGEFDPNAVETAAE